MKGLRCERVCRVEGLLGFGASNERGGRAGTRGPGRSKQVGAVVGRETVWCVVNGHGIEGTRVDRHRENIPVGARNE